MMEIRVVFWIFLAFFAMLALEPERRHEQDHDQDQELKTFNQLIKSRPSLDRTQLADGKTDRLMRPTFPGTDLEPDEPILSTVPENKFRPIAPSRPALLRLLDHRA